MKQSEQLIQYFDNEEKSINQINRIFQKIARNQKKLFESKKLLNDEVNQKVIKLEFIPLYKQNLFTPFHNSLQLPHEDPLQKCLDEKILPSLQTFQKTVTQTKAKIYESIKSSQRVVQKKQKKEHLEDSSKEPQKLDAELQIAIDLEKTQNEGLVQQQIPKFITEKVQQYQGLIQLLINLKMKQHAHQIELLTTFCQKLHQMNDSQQKFQEIVKIAIKKIEKPIK